MKNTIHIIHFLLFLSYQDYAQIIPPSDKIAPHTTLTLLDKVNKSDVVIEGTVINDTRTDCFLLDPKSRKPFTSIIIRISKIFKGEIKDTIIELIIEGGRIPSGEFEGVQRGVDGSSIGKGYEGIFFLRVNNTSIQSGKHIQSYFFIYSNSYIYYTTALNSTYHSAYYEGKNITDFENILYKPIQAITGTPAKVIGLNSFEVAAQKQKK